MTLAVILARANSKGIKNKNLALLGGKPLLYYTITAAQEAYGIDEIVCSSDGEEILEYASTHAIQTLKRPSILASDTARSDEALLHVLEHFRGFDTFILLQPTSPLRTAIHITKALELFYQGDYTTLISVFRTNKEILKSFILDEDGNLKGICNNTYPFMPRQALPDVFMSNGAIYISKTSFFKKHQSFLSPKTAHYEMSQNSSVDINEQCDLLKAQEFLVRGY